MCVQKIDFKNPVVATIASGKLGEIKHARLGSAVVVLVDKYNRFDIVNVCHTFDGYFSNNVTDYDKQCVE